MIPYKTLLQVDKKKRQPVYIQLTNQFIELIKKGTLIPNAKLPGTRTLAEYIGLHRKTIVACYDELMLQGWIESIPQKGTFVHGSIPKLHQQPIGTEIIGKKEIGSGFSFKKDTRLNRKFPQGFSEKNLYVNDGISDARLAPLEEIGILYRKIISKNSSLEHLSYGSTYGNKELRETLVNYLNETRGLNISLDNILITRGSQMGMFLAAQLLFEKDEYIIVGETNYSSSDTTFEISGGKLLRVKVDENGLDTKDIERLCKKYPIKAIYTTPHHHHPTTVTLSAKRRMHLLNLAKTYNFAIIEDDYDYDFHYSHAPILPLASHDTHGNVIYVGSICKTVAPVFRIGYLIASKEFVDECAKLRRFIDRQGDALLEVAFAKFIKDGSLDRHVKKVLKVYKERRDLFCDLLQKEVGNFFTFQIPKGSMAIWLTLDKKYSWEKVVETAEKECLIFSEIERYDMARTNHNAIRMGFASYNKDEICEFMKRLKNTMAILEI